MQQGWWADQWVGCQGWAAAEAASLFSEASRLENPQKEE